MYFLPQVLVIIHLEDSNATLMATSMFLERTKCINL